MFDSQKELLDAIWRGETSYLELKEIRFSGRKVVGPSRDSLADEIAAFANSSGGVLVLGVEDGSRDIVGIPATSVDAVVDLVRDVCGDSITPPLEQYVLDRLSLPTGITDTIGSVAHVVKVEVPRSLFVHRSPGGYFYRAGDSKRVMSPEFLNRLFQQRSQTRLIRFDEQVVAAAGIDVLSDDLCTRFITARSSGDRHTLLVKLGMAAQDGDQLKPTVAGVLMGSESPQRWLPNAFVQAVAYRGTRIAARSSAEAYQLDAADLTGPADRQIIETCRFVAKSMRVGARKMVGRVDVPQFDMLAVFEAVVNAVAHRDYAVSGSKIRLRLFEDRMDLYSPGALANSLTADSLRYRQTARNETLCSLLARCPVPPEPWITEGPMHFMERRGEGVPIILDNSTELSGRTPVYRVIDDAELMLTIYAADADNAPIAHG